MRMLHDPVWSRYSRAWVSLPKTDSHSLLKDEKVWWGYGPTNRNVPNLVRNAFFCLKVLWKERPTCIISTGAGLAIPFFVIGRLLGIRCIYIESFARKNSLSLTGKLVRPFTHRFIVQSVALAQRYPRTVHLGSIY